MASFVTGVSQLLSIYSMPIYCEGWFCHRGSSTPFYILYIYLLRRAVLSQGFLKKLEKKNDLHLLLSRLVLEAAFGGCFRLISLYSALSSAFYEVMNK